MSQKWRQEPQEDAVLKNRYFTHGMITGSVEPRHAAVGEAVSEMAIPNSTAAVDGIPSRTFPRKKCIRVTKQVKNIERGKHAVRRCHPCAPYGWTTIGLGHAALSDGRLLCRIRKRCIERPRNY